MTNSNSPSVRYMDFVGQRRSSSTDPLVRRPRGTIKVSTRSKMVTPTKKEKLMPVQRAESRSIAKAAEVPRVPVRPVTPTTVATQSRQTSMATRTEVRTPVKPVSSAKAISVEKSSERELIARKPTTGAKELYPTKIEESKKPAKVNQSTNIQQTKSPFLKDYSIDKRPLSSSVPARKNSGEFEKLSYLGVSGTKRGGSGKNDEIEEISSGSLRRSRKNVYERRKTEKTKRNKTPVRVVDDSEDDRGGLPLVVVILITVLLGAAVGAGVYFLLPK